MSIKITDEVVKNALDYFAENDIEIDWIGDVEQYHLHDYNTSVYYTKEELVLQYLRETKRRYEGKIIW